MGVVRLLLLLLHVAGVVALLAIVAVQLRRHEGRSPTGILHAALAMLVTGIALMGVNHALGHEVNNARATVKTVVLLLLLGLVLANRRRRRVPEGFFHAAAGLTLINTAIALLWS